MRPGFLLLLSTEEIAVSIQVCFSAPACIHSPSSSARSLSQTRTHTLTHARTQTHTYILEKMGQTNVCFAQRLLSNGKIQQYQIMICANRYLVLNEVAANIHVLTDWKRQSRQRALSCSITVADAENKPRLHQSFLSLMKPNWSLISPTATASLQTTSFPRNILIPQPPAVPATRALTGKKCALAGLCDVKRDIFLSNNNTQQCSSKWRRLPPS